MKIRTFYTLENGVYRVVVNTEDWSENDVRLMEKFGEPEINIGGDLSYTPTAGDPTPISWKIPDEYRGVRNETLAMSFDSRDTEHAEGLANAWADRTIGAVSAAFAALHEHSDDFTRETVHTLASN